MASPPFKLAPFSKTLYHGSTTPIDNFDVSKGKGRYGQGLYLTPSLDTAQFYAQGGRQGNAGQKLKGNGYIYEFKVAGKALKVLHEQDTMKEVVSDLEDAEDAFSYVGDVLSAKVTKYLGDWAKEFHDASIVWLAASDMGVLSPLEQILVTDQSAIKSFKPMHFTQKVHSKYTVTLKSTPA